MTTHQTNNRNYDVKVMESQSMTTKSIEETPEEEFLPSPDSSFSKRQFRFFKRQKQKNVDDEVDKNADKMLKDLGLYEEGMTKQQKLDILNIIAESQQLAEKEEHLQEENEKWEEELLRQSIEEKSPPMEIVDDTTQSPVFDYCNARNNHSDDEIPTIQYENDTVPGSQDLFTSKSVESPESFHHSAEENFESNKSDEIVLNSKPSKKVRVGVRKRKLQEISNSPFEENTSDREMELFSYRKYPLKQDVDYQAINVWNSREDNSSKLKINCQARKQLRRHDVPYFTPKGVTPHTQANCIVQDFENYFKLLHEAQNQVLNHMPWGSPVSVGRHHRGTLDVINCKNIQNQKKYLEDKDGDFEEAATIDDATETNSEQKEDPFLLNAIPLKNVEEKEFPVTSQETNVSINEEFAEGDIFEDDALSSLDTAKESSVFLQTDKTKSLKSPFHRDDSDVSMGCSGKSPTPVKPPAKKIKKTRSTQKIENGDSFFETREMEKVKNDCVIESESKVSGFSCTPPKKLRSSFLNGLNNADCTNSQQDLLDVLMYEEEEKNIKEQSQTGAKSVVPSELNLRQTSQSPPVIEFKANETSDLQTFNPIPEMEISNDSDSVACPLCAVLFPKSQIEGHASECNGVDDNSVVEMVVAMRTPKNKDRCYVCQNVFPKSKYEAHVNMCIASRQEAASDIQEESPIWMPTTTSKSTTGSRLLDGLTESEDLASTSKPADSGPFSPIKTFQPITNQDSTLIDYHNQFNQKKARQNRTKSEANLNAKFQAKKTKKKKP